MKNIFLTSSFADVSKLLSEFLPYKPEGETVAFVPTASLTEEVVFYVENDRKALIDLGFKVVELEITNLCKDQIDSTLAEADILFVAGGNTFFLMQELRKSGADSSFIDFINSGKLYIGSSAGSIILSTSLEHVQDMDDPGQAPELSDCAGLSVIDFNFLPHVNNSYYGDIVDNIIEEYNSEIELIAINDKEAVLINDDAYEIKSIAH
jgi:dipeptidase E